jgi:hypothetical protein
LPKNTPISDCEANIGKKRGWKYYPRSAFVALGEFSPEVVGCRDFGDQQQDGLEDRHRVAGAVKTSTGNFGDFCDTGASGAKRVTLETFHGSVRS